MEQLDLNLLRVFDVIYRTRNVSRAAELLGMSQPSTSQALTRLRLVLGDPLFERTRGGVRPTLRAEDLARSVQSGLAQIEEGLASENAFDPARSTAELRIHLTDIGEARFLPSLMREMRCVAPGIRLRARTWPQQDIGGALDSGDIHLAIGFLPELTTSTFRALPDIVKNTDLAVLMPQAIAREFTPANGFKLLDTELPSNDFTVSVHWSRRHAHSPLVRWTREVLLRLFQRD